MQLDCSSVGGVVNEVSGLDCRLMGAETVRFGNSSYIEIDELTGFESEDEKLKWMEVGA